MELCQILILSRAMHETEARKMDKEPGRAWRIRAIAKNSSHEIQLGREWEPPLLAQKQDEPLFGLSNNKFVSYQPVSTLQYKASILTTSEHTQLFETRISMALVKPAS